MKSNREEHEEKIESMTVCFLRGLRALRGDTPDRDEISKKPRLRRHNENKRTKNTGFFG